MWSNKHKQRAPGTRPQRVQETCGLCGGKKWSKCTRCNGTGYIKNKEFCPVCWLTHRKWGKEPCRECGANGKVWVTR